MSIIVNKLPYYTAENSTYSWVGRAWRNAAIALSNTIETFTNLGFGGPIANILASLIESGVSVAVGAKGAYQSVIDTVNLTEAEQIALNKYNIKVLAPTVVSILKNVDQSLAGAIQYKSNNSALIYRLNEALKSIAVLSLHGYAIDKNGVTGSSGAFSKELSSLIVKMCEYAEKALIIYATENITDYKLVEESTNVLGNTKVGVIDINLYGESGITNIKQYVAKDAVLTGGQIDVEVINVDPNDTTPATTETTVDEVPVDNNLGKKILKATGLIALGILLNKALSK